MREAARELAASGALRAAINLGNPLLVTGRDNEGNPVGVAPDIAREVAERLGVPVKLVGFASPGEVADAADKGKWDICLMGADPARAENISFTAAYVEIEATYLVPANSLIKSVSEVDRGGARISVVARGAVDLWLERNIKSATLVPAATQPEAIRQFVEQRMDALADLRPNLMVVARNISGARVLDGKVTAVQQAIGTQKRNKAGFDFLLDFAEEAKSSGLVQCLIDKYKVHALTVAPPGK